MTQVEAGSRPHDCLESSDSNILYFLFLLYILFLLPIQHLVLVSLNFLKLIDLNNWLILIKLLSG